MAAPRQRLSKTALKAGFRSGLEQDNARLLKSCGIKFTYEELKIPYVKKPAKYTPDFQLSNGIIIETKGFFVASDRSKHLLIKEQHPELDIRFVFSRSTSKISAKSKTTYGSWCDQHGFKYADQLIPVEWMNEV
jgi:hypothetical protein